ncbi:lipid II flippase MurJ [Stenotrophomonas mori]|uniref:Oligosaccharide flippase family protein n=1 Tax=Stenotrophomonas mori TaxID=2871096 RepID=A0ABT0SKX7_9GAMM|nr:lipid II flippase MurJ [Stenotrophomonas mori]MCL7715579.1 oligosaccharide flippase family protein [Stenotrophomonas mori]
MFRATLWLTLATLAGLALGFGREWLLVDAWGAGARTDAFLVGLFLPEAVRMTLAAGLLSSAALPLYQQLGGERRTGWLASQFGSLLLLGTLLAALLAAAAPLWVRLIGPGLPEAARHDASASLAVLAATVPLLLLHALAAAVAQAQERFLVAGLGSFLYNLPAVVLLLLQRGATDERRLAWAFVLGAGLMLASMLPLLWRSGWRPWRWRWHRQDIALLYRRLAPLLASAGASQGLALLERICASFLGEGAITLVNLARKLVNLPLVALMSLNQVVLARMTRLAGDGDARRQALRVGLLATAAMTVPAAAGMIAAAPTLVALLLPAGMAQGALPGVLAWFACVIVFGAWNALLARYAYARGDTVLPMRCELAGSAVNALALLLVPLATGLAGIAWAALAGCLMTALLFLRRYRLLGDPLVYRLPSAALLALAGAAPLFALGGFPWRQLGLASLWAAAWLGLLASWTVRRLRTAPPAPADG